MIFNSYEDRINYSMPFKETLAADFQTTKAKAEIYYGINTEDVELYINNAQDLLREVHKSFLTEIDRYYFIVERKILETGAALGDIEKDSLRTLVEAELVETACPIETEARIEFMADHMAELYRG